MKYITLEEFYGFVVKPEVVKLTEGKNGEPDEKVIEEVNQNAVSVLEGYLRGIYRLPLKEPVEPEVRRLVGELMRFYLRTRRNDQNVSPSVYKLHEITIRQLKDIKQRQIVLEAEALAGNDETGLPSGGVQSWTPSQKFPNHFTGFDGLSD